jgi:hypothetical protein
MAPAVAATLHLRLLFLAYFPKKESEAYELTSLSVRLCPL